MTFIDPNLGDIGLLKAHDTNLIGTGSSVMVREEVKGSVASSQFHDRWKDS